MMHTLLAVKNGAKPGWKTVWYYFQTGCYLLIPFLTAGQVKPVWDLSFKNGLNSVNKACRLEVDKNRNCYVLGRTRMGELSRDILLVKFTPDGKEAWRRMYDGETNHNETPVDMSLDGWGNVIITGIIQETEKSGDIVVLKYSPDGVLDFAKVFDGPGHKFDAPSSVTTDKRGNIIVTGYVTTADSGLDLIILRYRPDGSFAWMDRYTTSQMDVGNKALTDDSCNIYIAGNCNVGQHSSDVVLLKYDSAGARLWSRVYDGVLGENDAAYTMTMDDSSNVFITGFLNHTHDRSDVPVLEFNRNGILTGEFMYSGGISDCYSTRITVEDKSIGIAGINTDYSLGTAGTFVIGLDRSLKQQFFRSSPADDQYLFFHYMNEQPMILGTRLTHPESTLMPYMAVPDTGKKMLWEYADTTVTGMNHLLDVKIQLPDVYFLGDDSGDATGTILLMKYSLTGFLQKDKPKVKKAIPKSR
ncbi:MAG: hypothetical protein IT242_09855 [Bacteroidia bacterium]|nr:hypothetical protein [Bacteroidia bacterium]